MFTSQAAVEVTDQLLLDILVNADRRNRTRGISGLLLYSQNRFMQLIEARQQETVDALFAKIEQDARHTNVEVLLRQACSEFHMAAWAMGFSMKSKETSAIPKHAFYIHMDEVTNICTSMPGPVGQYFRRFLCVP
jgi:hypothetical protein